MFAVAIDCTWWVVPSISIGVFWLSENTGGHLVFPGRRLLLVCTQCDVGGATRRAQNPREKEMVNI